MIAAIWATAVAVQLVAADFKPSTQQIRHLMARVENILIARGYPVVGYASGPIPDFSKFGPVTGPIACWDQLYSLDLAEDALTKAHVAEREIDRVAQQVSMEIGANTEDQNCVPESID